MASRKLIITMDGPAGAGKSTVAKRLAEELGYLYLDTGAMYRAVALAAQRAGVSPEKEEDLCLLAEKAAIEFVPGKDGVRVFLNGEDVSEAIRTPEIDRLSSLVAKVAGVRRILVDKQRALGARGGVVAEGRDMGSVVFPEADVKFFLTASPEVRARRRFEELKKRGLDPDFPKVLAEIIERDRQDQERPIAPLVVPPGAIIIDTSNLEVEEVLRLVLAKVKEKLA